jgi:hypothetical protein
LAERAPKRPQAPFNLNILLYGTLFQFIVFSPNSIARNAVALTLIPLTAASLAVGVTSSGYARDFFAGAGAGGAALFGLGTYFTDQNRQRVYLAGEKAVTCAILAMRPALVETSEYARRQQTVVALDAGISAAQIVNVGAPLLQQAQQLDESARKQLGMIAASGFTLRQPIGMSICWLGSTSTTLAISSFGGNTPSGTQPVRSRIA